MRWTAKACVVALVALMGACDGDDGGDNQSGTDTDASGGSTSGTSTPEPSGSSSGGSNPTATSMPPGTNPATSSGGDESSTSADSSEESSAEGTTDPTEGETTEGETTEGGEDGGGSIDVTLTGCDVDFGGTIVVSYNGSLGVASIYDMGGTLSGSFQFDLEGPATMELSTQHRVDTGTVVNMVDVGQGTWTNIDNDALSGGVDSIGGTLDVQIWNPAQGQAEIVFDGVSLMNVTSGNVCTIDGVVIAEELYP